ncbi:MAG: DDE-type integrase/transposase/recombinase [Planctomycetota bacterium]
MTALKIANYDADDRPPAPKRTAEGNIRVPGKGPAAGATVDWSAWIAVEEAARILGRDRDALRRDCRTKLADRSLAMRSKGPDGQGQLRWWIKRDYNLKLHDGPVGSGNRIPEAFYTQLTENQRSQAIARATCVKRYRAMLTNPRTGPRTAWIGGLLSTLGVDFPGLKISERSLYRWHGLYCNEADLMKLADKRKGSKAGPIDPAAWQFFKDLFLHPNQRSRKLCHDLTCDKADVEGWRWHGRTRAGYTKTVRMVRAEISTVVRVKARDPERYRNTMAPYMVVDPDAFAPGERWQGDHCVLDMFCLFPGSGGGKVGRPWLTAWFDPHSSKCVGWVLSAAPSSETIREAFANAMRDPSNMGGPDIIHIDNGKDYKCTTFHGGKLSTKQKVMLKKGYADTPRFRGIFGILDIQTIFAIPKNSKGKGAIEKWFDYSIHQRFDKLWDTYSGKDPSSRPPGLQAKLKDKASLPPFEQVREALALHIAQYNDSCDHGKERMIGRSPNAVMLTARRRVLADPGVLDYMSLTLSQPVRVHNHAVTIRPLGKALRYSSTSSAFLELCSSGKLVVVGYRQVDLLGQVYLFDAETMTMICSAHNERMGGSTFTDAGRADIKAAMKLQRDVEKATKFVNENSAAATTPTELLALREANRRRRLEEEGPPTEPASGEPAKLIQTPLDGQSNKLRAAHLKKAAGAETSIESAERLELDMSDLAGRLRKRAATPAPKPEDMIAEPGLATPNGLGDISARLKAKTQRGA